jgi:UDP-N-acetylglucosamine--N-acetylmuramyl-(pentapeptide) pyrophosphoryl-undecaprenol N-acetylglucosamine transferase
MKLAVAGGGTGGHVYPGLAVIKTLLESRSAESSLPVLDAAQVLWIGSRGGLEEEMVRRERIDFVGLAAGGLRGKSPLTSLRNAVRIGWSISKARNILERFRPDVVFVTGGYACVSVTLAASRMKLPVLVYLPDIEPGLAIRFLSRFATRIAVTSEESYQFFPRDKVVVTGYPVRSDIFEMDKLDAQNALGLEPEVPTLLVFGGSRGARSINRALVAGLHELLSQCQVVHISGRLDSDWVAGYAKRLPDELRDRYRHFAYMDDMARALKAADLVVARSGAATMGEFPAAGLPSILVPYPFSGQHQQANADYMVENGAARVLADADLDGRLVSTIVELLSDESGLADMGESARAMARQDAAEAIARQLWVEARDGRSSDPGARR